MRIVYIGTAYPMRGGIAHFNALLARELARRHAVTFLSFRRQYPGLLFPGKTQFVTDAEAAAGARVAAEPLLDSIWPPSWWATARRAARERPDLLLLRYWMPFFAPAFGTVIRQVKRRVPAARTVMICDNIVPHERRPLDLALTRYALAPVDGFVVMSESVRDDLLRIRPEARWKLVRHPNYSLFGVPVAKAEARAALGLAPGPWVLFFGYIRPYKGLEDLITALPAIRARTGARLLVAGEFYEWEARIRRRVAELGLSDAVRFDADYIPDARVPLYFSAANAVVLPYRTATQSGIVGIAYHLETPVICTDVGGLAEVVPDGRAGFVVPPHDTAALAAAVVRFYDEGWEERLRAGVREERRKYSWDTMAAAVEALAGE